MALIKETPSCKHLLNMSLLEGIPAVEASIDGAYSTSLRIDTGASLFETESVYLNLTERDRLALVQIDPERSPVKHVGATGVGGTLLMPVYRLNEMRMGSLVIENPYAIIQPSRGYFALPAAKGFFGNNLLEKFSPVAIDYTKRKLGLCCEVDAE